jgi:hypothetical protein
MKVVKATRHTAVCEFRLLKPMTAAHSRSWANREAKAARRGRDPCQCAARSAWVLDGVPMCLNHAGQEALHFLAENG